MNPHTLFKLRDRTDAHSHSRVRHGVAPWSRLWLLITGTLLLDEVSMLVVTTPDSKRRISEVSLTIDIGYR
jgi:hypothetical protein